MASRGNSDDDPFIDYGDGLIHVSETAYNRGITDGRLGTGNFDNLSKMSPEVLRDYLEGYKFADERNKARGFTGAEMDSDPGIINRMRRRESK